MKALRGTAPQSLDLSRHFSFSSPAIAMSLALGVGAIFVAMLGARANQVPNGDELYHLLAASSWLDSGRFTIAEGEYTRASLFTRYVALAFALFGETFTAAKLANAAVLGVLTASVFAFSCRAVGFGPSLTTALLFLLSPHALEIGTTVRFYMPQAAFFWLGAWGVYYGTRPDTRYRVAYLVGAAMALALAMHMQVSSAIGILGVGVWVAGLAFTRLLARGVPLSIVFGLVAAIGVSAALAALVLPVGELWDRYQYAALWNRGSSIRYYYWVMTEAYNPFWGLLPLCALLALQRSLRAASFALSIFAIAFLLHSLGGMKEDRYLFYAFPFFFLLIALGLHELFRMLKAGLRQWFAGAAILTPAWSSSVAGFVAAGALAFLTISNLGYIETAKDIAAGTVKREQPDWPAFAAQYSEDLESSSVVLTNSPLHMLYYLDRMPIGIGRSRLLSGSDGREFSTDFRTGVPLISTVESLEQIVDCFPDGFLVVEERQWLKNPASGVNEDLLPIIESRMQPVEVPGDWEMKVFSWSSKDLVPSNDHCLNMPGFDPS